MREKMYVIEDDFNKAKLAMNEKKDWIVCLFTKKNNNKQIPIYITDKDPLENVRKWEEKYPKDTSKLSDVEFFKMLREQNEAVRKDKENWDKGD